MHLILLREKTTKQCHNSIERRKSNFLIIMASNIFAVVNMCTTHELDINKCEIYFALWTWNSCLLQKWHYWNETSMPVIWQKDKTRRAECKNDNLLLYFLAKKLYISRRRVGPWWLSHFLKDGYQILVLGWLLVVENWIMIYQKNEELLQEFLKIFICYWNRFQMKMEIKKWRY